MPPREQKFHAFWQHHMFPHTLSAEVEQFSLDGRSARMKGWGGDRFTYFAILPEPVGRELGEALVSLGLEKAKAINEINRDYDHRLHALFTAHGVLHPRYAKTER